MSFPNRVIKSNYNIAIYVSLLLTIAWSIASPSYGQTAKAEKQTWYKVELILFRQGGNPLESLEHWDPNPKMSYPLNWATLVTPESLKEAVIHQDETANGPVGLSTSGTVINPANNLGPKLGSDESIPLDPRSILMLPEEDFTLQTEMQKLQRSSKYRILFHGAWQQGFIDGKEPPAIIIGAGDMFDNHAELEGTIQLKLLRYLHLTTDLWLTQFTTNFGQERGRWPELPWPPNRPRQEIADAYSDKTSGNLTGWNQFSTAASSYDSLLAKPYLIENIAKINETRRMRSNELHYIDHPLLGILIQFTPSEAPTNNSSISTLPEASTSNP